MKKGKKVNKTLKEVTLSGQKLEYKDCPECSNNLTIFCVVPIGCASKYILKRFCPSCEHVW